MNKSTKVSNNLIYHPQNLSTQAKKTTKKSQTRSSIPFLAYGFSQTRSFSQEANEQQKTETKTEQTQQADARDARIKELETQLNEMKNQNNQLKSQLQYSMAEIQNISRISKQDVEKANKFGISGFAKQLLEVVDNLSRCTENSKSINLDHPGFKSLMEGVQMTEKELTRTLEKNGVIKLDPLGQKFDPNFMSALVHMEDPTKEPGTVGVVMKAGYKIHDRVLRAADVGVVKSK